MEEKKNERKEGQREKEEKETKIKKREGMKPCTISNKTVTLYIETKKKGLRHLSVYWLIYVKLSKQMFTDQR